MSKAKLTGSPRATDVAQTIAKLFKDERRSYQNRVRHHFDHVDIVSEKLCDDIVKYLAPTLKQHKGCTLIDINPGACTFSSKLHQFLEPKRHLLLEPKKEYFETFIKPLLDESGSTYRYVQHSVEPTIEQWEKLRLILQDRSLIPARPLLSADDPRRMQLDPSVLVIGNLARRGRMSPFLPKHLNFAPLLLRQLGSSALVRGIWHDHGLVRMLSWLPEMFKERLIPFTAHTRSQFNLGIDMALNVAEVAGVETLENQHGFKVSTALLEHRSALLDRVNTEAVADRMREARMEVPKERQTQPPERAPTQPDADQKFVSPFASTARTASELQERIDDVSTRIKHIAPFLATNHSAARPLFQPAMDTLQFPQSEFVVLNLTGRKILKEGTKAARLCLLLDMGLRLVNIEASYKQLEEQIDDRTTLDGLKSAVLTVEAEYDAIYDQLSKRALEMVSHCIEDQLIYFSSPALLPSDRRPYQPLQADTSDFYPQQNLALFDMVPKGRDLAVPDLAGSFEAARLSGELLKALFTLRTYPLPAALDSVAVNAGQDLIPMVPAITDVRKGGRLNPNKLPVRLLTEEMVEGLVTAFFEWPFRPRTWELALAAEENADTGVDREEGVQNEARDETNQNAVQG